MTGIEIFIAGAVAGVASKWGFDRFFLKKIPWASWKGAEVEQGSIILEDLKKITGVGPSYAGLLNQAGILNFADLAAQTPERVREIVKAVGLDETTEWIQQAKELSEGSNQSQPMEGHQAPKLASANA